MSSDVAIRVQGVSKRYRIGASQAPYKTLRESLTDLIMAPVKRLGRLGQPPSREETIWALKNVSFEIKRGEVVGIIGRNGAGKSTLLKILSRITEPTEGHAEIHGRVSSLLEVGTGFHPELSGRENIYLNGAILGMRKTEIDCKFDEMVAFAEVEKFIDTPVKHYSSGMHVRLAFAVAAHLEPEILLVDEVLAVGDADFQKKCLGRMGEIGREGRTVLLVSHNMPSIINLCHRGILFDKGIIAADGDANSVVETYIASSVSAAGEVVWPETDTAPGNDLVRLRSVRILQDGRSGPTADVDISKDVLVEITYECMKDGAFLYAAIWLRDAMGTAVLSSGNVHGANLIEDEWYGKAHPPGLYRCVGRIPANFLNDTRYSITPILGKVPNQTIVLEDYLLSFHVHDTGEMRKEFYGGWLGVVRPRLAWQTERLNEQVEIMVSSNQDKVHK
jgi:lipopolysaccharide transport system ATP-binding protein